MEEETKEIKAVKKENIKLIKKYCKEIYKMDLNNLDWVLLIGLEHQMFYNIYSPIKKEIKNK